LNAPVSAGISVVELLLFDALLFECVRFAAALLELLHDLLFFAGFEQLGSGSIQRHAALGNDPDLRDDTAIQELQMCVNALQLTCFEFAVRIAKHGRVNAKFFVETRKLAFRLIQCAGANGHDQLLLVFDALALIQHRLQREGKAFHVTLINLASVCSGELAS
jgi:hypothetical protein